MTSSRNHPNNTKYRERSSALLSEAFKIMAAQTGWTIARIKFELSAKFYTSKGLEVSESVLGNWRKSDRGIRPEKVVYETLIDYFKPYLDDSWVSRMISVAEHEKIGEAEWINSLTKPPKIPEMGISHKRP